MHDSPPTGDSEVKKSINFPTVSGILIDTLEETSNSPIAIVRGLRSGFARENILRKDDEEVPGSRRNAAGVKRVNRDCFCGTVGGGCSSCLTGGWVEYDDLVARWMRTVDGGENEEREPRRDGCKCIDRHFVRGRIVMEAARKASIANERLR